MRKYYVLISLTIALLYASNSFGQAVITYNSHGPFIGYGATFMYIEDLWEPIEIDPGPAGPNKTWNFSSFSGTEQEQINFINPEDTPFADLIGGTDINIAVLTDIEDEAGFAFMNINPSNFSLRAYGIMDEGDPLYFGVFDPSPLLMNFPFAYGNSFDTYGELEVDLEGMILVQKTWSTTEADAWGTITTPHGTYSSVLRVKTITTDSTLIYIGGNLVFGDGYVSLDYAWYSNNHRMPVFEILGDYEEDFIAWYVSYLVSETVGISEKTLLSLNVYPNPASSHVFVDIPEPGGSVVITMTDLNGRMVHQGIIPGNQRKYRLDTDNIPGGMYFIQMLRNNELIGSQKILLQH